MDDPIKGTNEAFWFIKQINTMLTRYETDSRV